MIEVTQSETELIKIPYSKFLKLELPRFAQRLIGLVERHNPEELKINVLFDLLVAQSSNIEKMIDRSGPHPLTDELNELRKKRALHISAFRFLLKVVTMEDEAGDDEDVKILNSELNHFFHNLGLSKNEEMYNQKIVQFFEAVKVDPKLSSALSTLGFMDHFNKLNDVHVSIQYKISSKLISISGRHQETTAQLKKMVLTPTKNLIKQIEIAPLLNPDLDYRSLYRELNQYLAETKVMINKRVLFNKRKAEEQMGKRPTQTAVANRIEEPGVKMLNIDAEELGMNGQGVNQVKVEPVKNEKAAATSSKTMQLPLVDNDNEALEK